MGSTRKMLYLPSQLVRSRGTKKKKRAADTSSLMRAGRQPARRGRGQRPHGNDRRLAAGHERGLWSGKAHPPCVCSLGRRGMGDAKCCCRTGRRRPVGRREGRRWSRLLLAGCPLRWRRKRSGSRTGPSQKEASARCRAGIFSTSFFPAAKSWSRVTCTLLRPLHPLLLPARRVLPT